jgi:hypothetical protein
MGHKKQVALTRDFVANGIPKKQYLYSTVYAYLKNNNANN